MTQEHKDITDPHIHEPKGASTATAGQVYIADGAGSGTWAALVSYASQAEAEAATNNTKIMTPLRSKQFYEFISGNRFNVMNYGAIGDGVTDDTQAFEDAIAAAEAASALGACVYAPSNRYKLTSKLLTQSDNIAIIGDGIGMTMFLPNFDGDVIEFSPASPATQIQRIGVFNLSVYSQKANATSGAVIYLSRANTYFIDNVEVAAHFGGLHLESCVSGYVDIKPTSDANFTSLKTGSYLVRSSQYSGGVLTAETHFSPIEARGQNGNNYLDYGFLIEACDGIWCPSVHVGFCNTAAIALKPATNSTQLTGVNFDAVYVDTVTSGAGLLVSEPSSSYTGIFGDHNINIVTAYNCRYPVDWNLEATDYTHINCGQFIQSKKNGIRLQTVKRLNIYNPTIQDPNVDAATNSDGAGIYISGGANATEVNIYNPNIRAGSYGTPYYGISIASGATKILIDRPTFDGVTSNDVAYSDNSNDGTVVITDGRSSKEPVTLSADGGGGLIVPMGLGVYYIDAAANATGLIYKRSLHKGRKFTLVSTSTGSVYDANNLKIAGTWSATADDCISFVSPDGTNCYETGRSAN